MATTAPALAVVLVAVVLVGGVTSDDAPQTTSSSSTGGGLTPDLARWLSKRETPSKISKKIAQDVFPGKGYGLRAEERIEANDTLMEVPASVFLSLKTAAEGSLGPVVEELFQGNCSANAILAVHLLHERRLGEASEFRAYVDSLPETFDLPLVWSREELEELNGTQLLPKVVRQRQVLDAEYRDAVLPVLSDPRHADLLAGFAVPFEDFLWASCCVLSRAFVVHTEGSTKLPVLIPGVDIFNTGQSETRLEIDNAKGLVSVVSDQEFAEGDQVFLNLGTEPNLGYMLTQGFALVNNPDDYVELFVRGDPDDPFLDTKHRILRYLNVTPGLTTFVLQRKGKIPKDLLTSLRVHTMKPSEFDDYKTLEGNKALNLQNELQASREVLLACQKSLQSFPTTVKEDDELLLQPGGLERRKAYAILYRRGEKLVYIEAMHAITENWNSILFAGDNVAD